MRVIIQNCSTLKYLTQDLSWVEVDSEAAEFRTTTQALDCCTRHQLEDVQIVMKFQQKEFDVHLPLRRSGCRN
ncbi:MAG: hypothetical protein ACO1QB_15820 [Verrucomicrobiales bacterium]